mgnify:CR=1 FL=1
MFMYLAAFLIGTLIGGMFGILTMCLVQIKRVNQINDKYTNLTKVGENKNERK